MTTQLIRSLSHLPKAAQGSVMTIGNFDGVHLGHQALIANVIAKARALNVPSLVMTFEPHPFEFFAQEKLTIPRLTRLREKFTALAACGVDYVFNLQFNQIIASTSAHQFATHLLGEGLRPKHVFIGDDFRFGRERQGDFTLLQAIGRLQGFAAEVIEVVLQSGERISSTKVRKALQVGDHVLANSLLGRAYSMMGRICPGDQLGRKLGFPTANIHLHRKLAPVSGVYAVLVHGLEKGALMGAANVGTRPTVDGTRSLLEVHLLDYEKDIYGRYVTVEFCHKLRDEEHYPDLETLKAQIANDVEATRSYFKIIRRV